MPGSLRGHVGALLYDWPRFLLHIGGTWPRIRNRREALDWDGRGARCRWEFTTDLHLPKLVPQAGRWLMQRALLDWPLGFREAPSRSRTPEVSFILGHRGRQRLPHLLATLRSIAGQRGASVEAVVVEQSHRPEIAGDLPDWVTYVHTPVDSALDYCRSATFNAGARMARAEALVLHDNDILVPEDYASEIRDRLREGWDFLDLKRFTFYLREEDTARYFERQEIAPDARPTVVQNLQGASIAVRKTAFEEIGGFDEGFVGWGGEDNDFWERAAVGSRVLGFGYLPFVHLWHPAQKGKLLGQDAPAVRRYHEMRHVSPRERIRRLRSNRDRGPATGS